MNNDLEQFSEERLKGFVDRISVGNLRDSPTLTEMIALSRIALAAKQAKPVGYLFVSPDGGIAYSISNVEFEGVKLVGPIYSTPQPAHTEQDGWIKCIERMPDRGVDVLACKHSVLHGFIEIETAQWHGGMINETQPNMITSADSIQPTHWMPLPAAPKPESE